MIRKFAVGILGAALALSAASFAPARMGDVERPLLTDVVAALPSVRAREAETVPSSDQRARPDKPERRCTFGIFPQASSRCIA